MFTLRPPEKPSWAVTGPETAPILNVLANFASNAGLARRGTIKKQNEHDDPSSETAVFLIKSSYNAAALIDSRRKQKSR